MNTYDPFKAAEVARAQGFAIAHTAGLYSTSTLSNIAAPSVEVLNQNGYSIYVNDDGSFNIKQDRDTKNGTIWNSDSLGVTFDYTGDNLKIIPNDDKSSDSSSSNSTSSNNNNNNNNFSSIFDNNISDFNANGQAILNRLEAAANSGASYGNLGDLNVDETVDPYTGRVVDKEKSQAVDELLNNESVQYKFDKLIDLINKTGEARFTQEAEYKFTDGLATTAKGVAAGAAAGAAIATIIPIPVLNWTVGAVVGGVCGLVGGVVTAVSDSKDTEKLNQTVADETAEYAGELNSELEKLLQEGNEEEFIAFERYYQQQTGCSLSDVLKSLDTSDSDSAIAQAAGFDDAYILDKLEKIDASNSYLEPDEETGVAETNTNNNYSPETDLLEKKAALYYQAWCSSLSTGSAVVMGEEYTSKQLEKMYINAYNELSELKN